MKVVRSTSVGIAAVRTTTDAIGVCPTSAPGEDAEGPRQFEPGGGTHTLEVGYRENRVRLDSLLVTADGMPPIGRGLVPSPEEG